MENTFVVNDEPITIKITIEVIPSKKKEDVKEVPVVAPTPVAARQTNSPDGWDAIEPETPTVVPPIEPVATPEKKKRAYTKKTKDVIPAPEDEKIVEPLDTPPIKPVVPATPTIPANKVVARLAQMIRFYCKASGIETSTVTIAHLKEKAFDMVENVSDDVINEAIKEASMK